MAFPAASVVPPVLVPWQASYNNYLFGPGQPYELKNIDGAGQPAVRSGDAGRARDHGVFIGLDLMGNREITFTGELLTSSATAWANIAGATVPGGVTEQPLFLNLPNFGTVATLARPRKRDMPLDITAALGQLVNVTLLFASSDPRLYSTPTVSASVSPPGTTAGFSFPMGFPLSFGGGSVAGALSVVNAGDIDIRPILTVTGPCTNPSITNASLPGSPNLTFNLTMASGDTLTIDTDFHTATYLTAGSTIPSTRLQTQARGNTWWSLWPGGTTPNTVAGGVNQIQFLTSDPTGTGTLTVTAPSAAYIL